MTTCCCACGGSRARFAACSAWVEEGRDCREIVIQVAAIKSALASVNSQVLQCYASNCLGDEQQPRDRTIAELIELFQGTK